MSPFESRMSLRNLRLVATLAREGSLLRTAQALNMTHSAVTKALQDIESGVGAPLFTRTNRGAVPTPMGQALVAHAHVILAQLRQAAQELGDLRDGSGGTVVAGTLLAASAALLPRAIAGVKATRPDLVVRLV